MGKRGASSAAERTVSCNEGWPGRFVLAAFALAALAAAPPAPAATWDGGGADTNWTTAAN